MAIVADDAGDDFAGLYAKEYGRLVRALELAGAGRVAAEDVAQEAFARTLARWRRVRAGTNPAGYVYRVAFRTLSRDRRALRRFAPAVDGEVAGAADLAVARTGVTRALAAMPPRRRSCAVLCLVFGYDTAEVGEVLGIKPSTVRKHLAQAREDLSLELAG